MKPVQVDQTVYDLIHALLEEQTAANKRKAPDSDTLDTLALARDLRVSEVLAYAQTKNVYLRRMKKVTLERSIQTMLEEIRKDEDDELADYIEQKRLKAEVDQIGANVMTVRDTNDMNRAVISQWATEKETVKETTSTETKEAPEPERKKRRKARDYSAPAVTLSQLGGMGAVTSQLMELVGLPILHPELYLLTGVEPPRGVLLYGPPGCGKTTIANALAGELQVPFINILAPLIVSGMSGESEKKLREVFEDAKALAPCLVFMDEIDAITPKRDNSQREMEKRIVAQLLTLMDELSLEKTNNKPVIVIGATNRPDSLDSALRRAGRFDREICLNVPDEAQRCQILQAMVKNLKITEAFDFHHLAKLTPGFVGADLKSLVTASGVAAIKRIFETLSDEMDVEDELQIQKFLKSHPEPLSAAQLEPLCITFADFLAALPHIQPSAKREGFATIPDVSWDNVGALARIRMELHMCIVQPIKKPELFEKVGITAPAGVLMWGPPGCGKTLLAKAVANELRANFISIKGPELLNKYVGESERAIRQVFQRARASVPCIIFFDELDALVPKRDNSQSESSSRVVNTLLTELDGLNDRKGIFVIGATNRPDIIDPAMIRPGRLDKSLYIELPSAQERLDILHTLIKVNKTPVDLSVDLAAIVDDQRCRNFSGADLSSLVREAGVLALKRKFFHSHTVGQLDKSGFVQQDDDISGDIFVTGDDFMAALGSIKPSVSDRDRQRYERLNRRLGPVVSESGELAGGGEPSEPASEPVASS